MSDLPQPILLTETAAAPNPRRVRIFLAEKGVEIPRREIDLMAEDHRRPEYLAKAGAPVLPMLELSNGAVLTETVAICRYIEALRPEPPLMGVGPLDVAVVEMWQRRVEFGLFTHIAAVFRHLNPRMAHLEAQCPEWGEASRSRVDAGLRMLDTRLSDSAFIAGPRYSIADITGFVALDFMRVTRITVPPECGALTRWLTRMRARPSATA